MYEVQYRQFCRLEQMRTVSLRNHISCLMSQRPEYWWTISYCIILDLKYSILSMYPQHTDQENPLWLKINFPYVLGNLSHPLYFKLKAPWECSMPLQHAPPISSFIPCPTLTQQFGGRSTTPTSVFFFASCCFLASSKIMLLDFPNSNTLFHLYTCCWGYPHSFFNLYIPCKVKCTGIFDFILLPGPHRSFDYNMFFFLPLIYLTQMLHLEMKSLIFYFHYFNLWLFHLEILMVGCTVLSWQTLGFNYSLHYTYYTIHLSFIIIFLNFPASHHTHVLFKILFTASIGRPFFPRPCQWGRTMDNWGGVGNKGQ